MKRFSKYLLAAALLIGGIASAQTPTIHVYPALDTNNTYTGNNAFTLSPTVPTATLGDSTSKVASTQFATAAANAAEAAAQAGALQRIQNLGDVQYPYVGSTNLGLNGLANDAKRSPVTYTNSVGTAMGKSYIMAIGNSTVVGTEYFVAGMIGSGFLPITHRTVYNSASNALTCDNSGNCTALGLSNADGYLKAGQYITWYAEYPNCLAQGSYPVVAATATSVSFTGVASGVVACNAAYNGQVAASYTNQFVKCAQNGGTLATYLANTAGCPQTQAISLLQAAKASGLDPVVYFRGYLINDLRLGQMSFSTALTEVKTALTNLNNAVPNIPIIYGSENSITQAADGFVVPVATTVTSGAITPGTNTVTLASMPYSLYPGLPAPIELAQPNGTPFQVVIDSQGTPETLNITAMTPTTITFTNAYAHDAGFAVIATQATAAQVLTNALHETGIQLEGVYPNVTVFGVQDEVCGRQSAPASNVTCNYNSLHPGQQGQWMEGEKLAQRISSVGSINPHYDDPDNAGITFAYNYESSNTPLIGAYPNLKAIDEKFSYQCAAQGRNNNFYMPEIACPLADEDPNYDTLIVMGTGSITSNLIDVTSTENLTNYGNGVTTGDKVCVRNKGCFTPTYLAPTYNGGVVGDNRYVYTGTNPYVTAGAEDTIEIYRPKNVDVGSVAYSQAPLVYPYHLYGTITAASANSYTLTLVEGLNGITANQTSVQSGDAVVVQGVASTTVNSTTTCAASGFNLVCTDTVNTGYTAWSGHLVDVWSTRAPDTNATNSNAIHVTTQTLFSYGVTVSAAAPPTIVIVAAGQTGGTLPAGITQCYRVTSLTTVGESLPSAEVCGTTVTGTTNYLAPFWYPVAGATGYKVYGRTSGSELYMGTVTGSPNAQFPTGTPAYEFYDLNTITPSGSLPTTDTTTAGTVTPYITINGATSIRGTTSANPLAVTCPAGGSGTQYCSAAGNWVTPAGAPGAYTTTLLGGSALAVGACSSVTLAVSGLTVTNDVHATPQTYPGDGFWWEAYPTSGAAIVKVCASIAGTPNTSYYNVRVQ